MWILLEFVNDYDQQGGYFVGVFESHELAEESVDHIGRIRAEGSWYEIKKVELNKFVDIIDFD